RFEQYGRGGRRCEELANPGYLAARPRAVLLVCRERGVSLDDQERALVLAERAVHRVLQVARFATDVFRELRQQFDQLIAPPVLRLQRGHENDFGHHLLLGIGLLWLPQRPRVLFTHLTLCLARESRS